MKQFFKFMLASMLGSLLLFVVVVLMLIGTVSVIVSTVETDKEVSVKSHSVLQLDFNNPVPDRSSNNPLQNFNFETFESNPIIGLNEVLSSIDNAKNDENIDGILINSSFVSAGLGTIEEIRLALIDFKSSGKFIYSYSDAYSQGAYYLASVADEIHMNPAGYFDWKGFGAQLMFFKGAMDKLEIQPQIFRHGKFKSAIEPFILDKMSDENRLQSEQFIGSFWDHVVKNISLSRSISEARLNEMADKLSVTSPQHALENKFVDHLSYRDEVISKLKEMTGSEKLELVKLSKYRKVKIKKSIDQKVARNNKLAVIYASGEIIDGKSTDDMMGSETVSKAIRDARLDEKVKAIVLRVNSPGGSALASEVIWREMVLAKEVKPVVVSMGNYAASGGYYIACAADRIVANENTTTGSIGVFGMVPNMKGLFNNKLGVTFDTINTNKHSDYNTVFRPLDNYERNVIQGLVERIYDDFITHVAEGRGMTKPQVDSIGQGRVWSGTDAREIGLVDEIGGLNKAIEIALELGGLDSNYRIKNFPEKKDSFEAFFKGISDDVRLNLLKSTFGENLKVYNQMENYLNRKGIYARMPFDYILN